METDVIDAAQTALAHLRKKYEARLESSAASKDPFTTDPQNLANESGPIFSVEVTTRSNAGVTLSDLLRGVTVHGAQELEHLPRARPAAEKQSRPKAKRVKHGNAEHESSTFSSTMLTTASTPMDMNIATMSYNPATTSASETATLNTSPRPGRPIRKQTTTKHQRLSKELDHLVIDSNHSHPKNANYHVNTYVFKANIEDVDVDVEGDHEDPDHSESDADTTFSPTGRKNTSKPSKNHKFKKFNATRTATSPKVLRARRKNAPLHDTDFDHNDASDHDLLPVVKHDQYSPLPPPPPPVPPPSNSFLVGPSLPDFLVSPSNVPSQTPFSAVGMAVYGSHTFISTPPPPPPPPPPMKHLSQDSPQTSPASLPSNAITDYSFNVASMASSSQPAAGLLLGGASTATKVTVANGTGTAHLSTSPLSESSPTTGKIVAPGRTRTISAASLGMIATDSMWLHANTQMDLRDNFELSQCVNVALHSMDDAEDVPTLYCLSDKKLWVRPERTPDSIEVPRWKILIGRSEGINGLLCYQGRLFAKTATSLCTVIGGVWEDVCKLPESTLFVFSSGRLIFAMTVSNDLYILYNIKNPTIPGSSAAADATSTATGGKTQSLLSSLMLSSWCLVGCLRSSNFAMFKSIGCVQNRLCAIVSSAEPDGTATWMLAHAVMSPTAAATDSRDSHIACEWKAIERVDCVDSITGSSWTTEPGTGAGPADLMLGLVFEKIWVRRTTFDAEQNAFRPFWKEICAARGTISFCCGPSVDSLDFAEQFPRPVAAVTHSANNAVTFAPAGVAFPPYYPPPPPPPPPPLPTMPGVPVLRQPSDSLLMMMPPYLQQQFSGQFNS